MSRLGYRVFAAVTTLVVSLLGCAGSLQAAGCSTAANVTTCTPANGQLVFDDPSGKYLPYGTGSSAIVVSGVGGPVSAVSVTLNGVNGPQRAQHMWAMLVAPNGTTNLVFFGRPCNGASGHRSFAGQTFTIADNGTATFPGGSSTSPNCDTLPGSPPSYKPITDDSATNILFPSPAPAPTYAAPGPPPTDGTFNSQFFGITGNGTWTLYFAGLANAGETGTIGPNASSPAWTLSIAFSSATATNTTVSSNLNPSFTSAASSMVTLTASVTSSSTVNAGAVTFKDGTNALACSGGNQTVVSGSATCQFTFPTEGAHIITAQYVGGGSFAGSNSPAITQVVNSHTTSQVNAPGGTVGFCNTGPITIPQTGSNGDPSATPASPYASEIFVSGQTGIIQNLQVYLNGFTSSEPFAEGFLLVSPGGKTLDFLSQAGGGQPFNNFNFIIADSGVTQMPDASAPSNNTTYKPSSYTNSPTTYCQSAVCNGVTVSEPAPNSFDSAAPRGSKTMLGEFGGLSANGTWQLFVVDRQPGQTGSVTGGWCLNFTLAVGAHPTTTSLVSSLNPSFLGDSVTFTATVVNQDNPTGQINEGTVTFLDGLTNLGTGNVTFNGTANVATFTTNNPLVLNERTHPISATYNGTPNFGFSSSNTVQQVVNRHTVLTISSPTYSYCNQGPVTVPAAGAANALQGVARPYPSNIFVSNLPGVTNKVTLSLNNYTSNLPSDFASLLVGPGGGPTFAFDFFSRVGGTNCVGDPNCVGGTGFNGDNLTFQDGSGTVPALSSGQTLTVGMNSGPGTNTWPAPAPASFLYATPQGSALLSAFNNQNNLGTWSLYMQNLVNGAFGGIGDNVNPSNPSLNAWCVNLRQTLPDISLTATPMTHSPTTFIRGQSASFTITATNLGPGPTGDPTLTITDLLPAGLTFTGFSGSGWNCSVTSGTPATGQTVTCTNPTPIAANNSSAVTLNVTVGVGNATADIISHTATLTAGTGGDNNTPGNNTTTSGNITVAGTTLTINKTHTDPFTQGQVGATYSITVSNRGADNTNAVGHVGATAGIIMVTDALPTIFTVTAVGGTGWTCQPPASGVICTLNASLAVGSTTNPITVTVTVSNSMLGPVTNTAILTATTDQLVPANNNHDDATNIMQVPTQLLLNAGSGQSAMVNTAFSTLLSVTVEDAGNNPVAGVNVTFTPPGSGASGTFAVVGGCTASSCAVNTNGSGIATASTFTANGTIGGYNVHTASGTLPAKDFALTNTDTPATVTSLNSTTANGSYGASVLIPITVTFSKAVVVTGTPTLTLNDGAVINYTSGSGSAVLTFNYTVAAGQNTAKLDAASTTALALNGGTIKNPSTLDAALTLPVSPAAGALGVNKSIAIDTTAPTVTNVTSTTANGTYGVAVNIAITVTFSESVNVTGTPQLALNSGGTANYSSGTGSNTLIFSYTVAAGQNSAHLDYTSTGALALNGGTIKDAALNAATLTLPTPGAAGSLGGNTNIVIDTTAATATNVTSTTANGTYGAGASVAITVTFSKPVNVMGTPQLALNSGGTASYSAGTGSNTLIFSYTVAAGQNSAHLDYTSTSALTLNGGTIKDAALNAATLTLPAPGAAGSLGANKSIVIDTTAPTVTNVTSTTANGTYGTGASIAITVTFSKPVNVTGTPQLALNSGGTASYSSGTSSNTLIFSYTVAAGQNSAHLDYTSTSALTLNGGTIKDTALNAATLTLPAPGAAGSLGANTNIVINTAAAATTTTASNASANFNVADQLVTLSAVVTSGAGQVNAGTVTFTVLQGVTVIGLPVTSTTVTGGAANATFTLPGGTAAAVYTVQAVYNPGAGFAGSSDSTHTLTVNSGAAATTTTASNASANFSASDQLVTLSAMVTSGAGQVNAGTVTFTVLQGATVIGSAVTSATVAAGSASANFTLPGGTAAAAYTIQAVYNAGAGFAGSSDSTHTLTVNGSGAAPNVTAQFTVTGGVITYNRATQKYSQQVALINNGADLSSVALVLDNLSAGVTMLAPSGTTSTTSPPGSPYTEIGPIIGGGTANIVIQFTRTGTGAITYTPRVLGAGTR